jgi:hypothetical protein
MMAASEFVNLWIGHGYPWQLIALILVSISFLFSALAYMLSKLFKSEGLKKFANSEFLAALSTLLLVSLAVIFITFLDEIAAKFAVEILRISDPAYAVSLERAIASGQASIFSYPIYYVEKMINCSEYAWVLALCIDMPVEITSGYEGLLATPGLTIRNMMHEINSTLSYLIFILYLQKHMLIFSAQTMLTLFLPIGIICRAFPLTRGIGNTLIAVAIGFYFVFPLSYYLVLGGFYFPNIQSECSANVIKDPLRSFTAGGCAEVFAESSIYAILPSEIVESGADKIGLKEIFTSGSLPSRVLAGGTALAASSVAVGAIYNKFFRGLIVDFNIFAIIVPLVAMAITLTFVRSFAMLIGVRADDLIQGMIRLI